jgi:hypothetical protein
MIIHHFSKLNEIVNAIGIWKEAKEEKQERKGSYLVNK